MSARLRQIVAAFLAGAILLAGSGFDSAFGSAVEHGLGIESSTGQPAPADSGGAELCDHGCAGHLSFHLVSLTGSRALAFIAGPATRHASHRAAWRPALRPDSFFRPPRAFSLA